MTDEELAGEMLSIMDRVAKQRKLESAETGLLDILVDDAHAVLNGRQGEAPDGGTGGGCEDPPAGSP
jgi:hypothetical protein